MNSESGMIFELSHMQPRAEISGYTEADYDSVRMSSTHSNYDSAISSRNMIKSGDDEISDHPIAMQLRKIASTKRP